VKASDKPLLSMPAEVPSPQPSPEGGKDDEEKGVQRILLDYPVRSRPRYGWGLPDHPGLTRILWEGRDGYRDLLLDFATNIDALQRIQVEGSPDSAEPSWINNYYPGLDAVALYGMLSRLRPRLYMEVGSGNSTKFVRRALRDQELPTRLVSVDPHPRAEVDALCDEVIRQPLEDVDPSVVDRLEPGDVFFIDGSHRVFMNSDVVATFLDFMPRLKPGIHVHIHDIWIPSDYPPDWASRFYSEQYLLAAQLLARTTAYRVEFPGWFVGNDPELSLILMPLWDLPHMRRVERHGCSFWLETK
jgi:hypothetical protein